MFRLPLTCCLAFAISTSALAGEHLYAVDESVAFDLSTPEATADYRVQVPEPGLLAFETDFETFRRLSIEVLAPNGTVVGHGGARIGARGPYTIRLRRHRRYATGWDGKGTGVLAFWAPDIDAFEPNDSAAAAAVLVLGEDHAVAGGPVTLFPAGDEDHFVLRLAQPGYVTPALSIPAFVETGYQYQLFGAGEEGRPWRFGQARLLPAGDVPLVLRGTHPQPAPVGLRFDYAPNWDACEPNDQVEKACDISDGRAVAFSLFPPGDWDWFSFTVERPGAIALSISGLPPTEYDAEGRVLRGLEIEVRTDRVPGGSSRPARYLVSHGSVFIGAPNAGAYRFALSGRWLDADPVRAMTLRAHSVDPASGAADSNFSILGVYGTGADDPSVLGLMALAGLGSGGFYTVSSADDIVAAMRNAIGLADAPVDRTPPDQDSGKRTQPEPPPRKTVAEPEAPPSEDPKKKTVQQQAALAKSAEEIELDRLRQLEKILASAPEAVLWRHYYAQSDGAELKRLEALETAALAGESELMKSEKLSPKMSRRLLAREIQGLE